MKECTLPYTDTRFGFPQNVFHEPTEPSLKVGLLQRTIEPSLTVGLVPGMTHPLTQVVLTRPPLWSGYCIRPTSVNAPQ
jgi:hypothetical protein